jgi:hypothetical protein
MASAVVVGAFEHQLDARVLLAFVVPGVVFMADAVGPQTEAILIRGLSVGVSMREVIRREAVMGLIVGAAVGATFAGFAALVWGDEEGGRRARARCELLDREPRRDGPAMDVPAARRRPGVWVRSTCDGHPGPAVDRGLLRDGRADRHVARPVRVRARS